MTVDITLQRATEPYQVCVVGGGCAGLAAALSAARCGARTALVTDRMVLGGNASSELRIPPCGSGYYNPWATETGVLHELIVEDRVLNHDAVGYGQANGVWDFVLYDACRREPNLTLYLGTSVTTVTTDGARRVTAVAGPQAGSGLTLEVGADVFVDASGDGSVGIGAGVPWIMGPEARARYGEALAPEEPDDFVMGCTLTFRARDVGYEVPYQPPAWAQVYDYPDGIPGRSTSSFAGGYWWIEIGWPFHPMHDQDAIREELLRHVYGIWDHIKNRGREREQARTWVLDWVGMLPAKRESRRFIGAHVLTQQELQSRQPFPDTVAYGGWSIDDHTRGGILAVDQRPSFDKLPELFFFCTPYPVPLRSLFVNEFDNLFLAGRVMSASRIAFSSLRVQQTLATIGQAAGTAAAQAALTGQPAGSPALVAPVQRRLMWDDAYLPGHQLDHLAADATATASSVGPVIMRPGESAAGIPLASRPAALLPLSEERLDTAEFWLDNAGDPAEARLSVYLAKDIWDLAALDGQPVVETSFLVPGGGGPVACPVGAAVPAQALVWLRLEGPATVTWRYAANDPPATVCAYQRPAGRTWFAPSTWSRWKSLTVKVTPEPRPYRPEQALTGLGRPAAAVNCWLSDPAEPLPQWIEARLPAPRECDQVQLLFDTHLNRINLVTPGLFRAPEVVRDYRLEVESGGRWAEVAVVTGNYQRRRRHPFASRPVSAIRVTVTATNGDASARLCGLWAEHSDRVELGQ